MAHPSIGPHRGIRRRRMKLLWGSAPVGCSVHGLRPAAVLAPVMVAPGGAMLACLLPGLDDLEFTGALGGVEWAGLWCVCTRTAACACELQLALKQARMPEDVHLQPPHPFMFLHSVVLSQLGKSASGTSGVQSSIDEARCILAGAPAAQRRRLSNAQARGG